MPILRARAAALVSVATLAVGAFAVATSTGASAETPSPPTPPAYVAGSLEPILHFSPRAEYVDAHGIHHCLPGGTHTTTVGQTGDYPEMWFAMKDPACDFRAGDRTARLDALTTRVKALEDKP